MQTATKVFIPHDDHVWVAGHILQSETSQSGIVEVQIDDEELPRERATKVVSLSRYGLKSLPLQNLNMSNDGVDDMTKLGYLHEASILDNLRRRFKSMLPYTYTGEICVAINPYTWLDIYNDKFRSQYSRCTRHELPPHIYATSTDAYRCLTSRNRNQSVLVSGESGAGKTETVKILMDHLAYIAGKSDDRTVGKLLRANPLLESFGNAKTVRNDNSSRFGKFSQLEFNDFYVLVGSKCVTYLLEKSRVISQTKNERNYHIMYQLLAAPPDTKEKLLFTGLFAKDFNYLASGDLMTRKIEDISDEDRFLQTTDGLHLLGIGAELMELLLEALASILHLGQICFSGNDAAKVVLDDQNLDNSTIASCRMLGVDPETFTTNLVTRSIEVEGKRIALPLNVVQAASSRDALSKDIYARIFNWLVMVINFNTSFACNAEDSERQRMILLGRNCSTISLLDIFGFECFATNGFEQFCINYANEKLQQRFTADVFKTVQLEYDAEGLQWEKITYNDNQDTIEMIEGNLQLGRRGIIDILNEECQMPKGTDSNFQLKVKNYLNTHPSYVSDQRIKDTFAVRHYAGQVTYSVIGFVETNKDTLPNDLEMQLSTSENIFVRKLFCAGSYFFGQSSENDATDEDRNTLESILLLKYGQPDFVNVPIIMEPSRSMTRPARASTRVRGMTLQAISHDDGCNSNSSDMYSPTRTFRVKSMTSSSFLASEKILTKFKNQLASLMDMVNTSDVQYVRCIKPNSSHSSLKFDRRMVVEQLRSAGMIEAIRISRAAYPNQLLYHDFLRRYLCLKSQKWYMSNIPTLHLKSFEDQMIGQTKSLLVSFFQQNPHCTKSTSTNHYAFGKTRVYFSSFVLEQFESFRDKALNRSATKVQAFARAMMQRYKYLLLKRACKIVQHVWKGQLIRRRTKLAMSSIRKIQCIVRMWLSKVKVSRMRDVLVLKINAATKIQSTYRGYCVRRDQEICEEEPIPVGDIEEVYDRLESDTGGSPSDMPGWTTDADADGDRSTPGSYSRSIWKSSTESRGDSADESLLISLQSEIHQLKSKSLDMTEDLDEACAAINDYRRREQIWHNSLEAEKRRSYELQVHLEEAERENAAFTDTIIQRDVQIRILKAQNKDLKKNKKQIVDALQQATCSLTVSETQCSEMESMLIQAQQRCDNLENEMLRVQYAHTFGDGSMNESGWEAHRDRDTSPPIDLETLQQHILNLPYEHKEYLLSLLSSNRRSPVMEYETLELELEPNVTAEIADDTEVDQEVSNDCQECSLFDLENHDCILVELEPQLDVVEDENYETHVDTEPEIIELELEPDLDLDLAPDLEPELEAFVERRTCSEAAGVAARADAMQLSTENFDYIEHEQVLDLESPFGYDKWDQTSDPLAAKMSETILDDNRDGWVAEYESETSALEHAQLDQLKNCEYMEIQLNEFDTTNECEDVNTIEFESPVKENQLLYHQLKFAFVEETLSPFLENSSWQIPSSTDSRHTSVRNSSPRSTSDLKSLLQTAWIEIKQLHLAHEELLVEHEAERQQADTIIDDLQTKVQRLESERTEMQLMLEKFQHHIPIQQSTNFNDEGRLTSFSELEQLRSAHEKLVISTERDQEDLEEQERLLWEASETIAQMQQEKVRMQALENERFYEQQNHLFEANARIEQLKQELDRAVSMLSVFDGKKNNSDSDIQLDVPEVIVVTSSKSDNITIHTDMTSSIKSQVHGLIIGDSQYKHDHSLNENQFVKSQHLHDENRYNFCDDLEVKCESPITVFDEGYENESQTKCQIQNVDVNSIMVSQSDPSNEVKLIEAERIVKGLKDAAKSQRLKLLQAEAKIIQLQALLDEKPKRMSPSIQTAFALKPVPYQLHLNDAVNDIPRYVNQPIQVAGKCDTPTSMSSLPWSQNVSPMDATSNRKTVNRPPMYLCLDQSDDTQPIRMILTKNQSIIANSEYTVT